MNCSENSFYNMHTTRLWLISSVVLSFQCIYVYLQLPSIAHVSFSSVCSLHAASIRKLYTYKKHSTGNQPLQTRFQSLFAVYQDYDVLASNAVQQHT